MMSTDYKHESTLFDSFNNSTSRPSYTTPARSIAKKRSIKSNTYHLYMRIWFSEKLKATVKPIAAEQGSF